MPGKKEYNRLLAQGYSMEDITKNPHAYLLTRWTPLMCVIFSIVGLILASWQYFLIVAILNLSGALSRYSFYDRLYTFLTPLIGWGKIPAHGHHRKIGCGLGAMFFFNAGFAQYTNHLLLAYLPVFALMVMALMAGIFNWCFVTTVSNIFTRKVTKSCC